ncbi:MAG: hypothetical protein RLZ10_1022 [Bacteroidota bacterium]|jgi:hypothetical protein
MKNRKLDYYLVFIEAWILLHVSKAIILFFPFKKIAAKLGVSQVETPKDPIAGYQLSLVEISLKRAVKYTVHNSKCYDQALAAKFMLNRQQLPSTLYFGLSKEDNQLSAHAWVRCGDTIVIGKRGFEKYTPVAWFGTVKA